MEHHDSHHQNLHEDSSEHVHRDGVVNYVSTGWFTTTFAEIPENDYIYTPIEYDVQKFNVLQEIEQ